MTIITASDYGMTLDILRPGASDLGGPLTQPDGGIFVLMAYWLLLGYDATLSLMSSRDIVSSLLRHSHLQIKNLM
jgi:hypothetical protein